MYFVLSTASRVQRNNLLCTKRRKEVEVDGKETRRLLAKEEPRKGSRVRIRVCTGKSDGRGTSCLPKRIPDLREYFGSLLPASDNGGIGEKGGKCVWDEETDTGQARTATIVLVLRTVGFGEPHCPAIISPKTVYIVYFVMVGSFPRIGMALCGDGLALARMKRRVQKKEKNWRGRGAERCKIVERREKALIVTVSGYKTCCIKRGFPIEVRSMPVSKVSHGTAGDIGCVLNKS